jgi:hypothetical protein
MALRLRRGTDSERQLITPAEGELIYTTDTKKLWSGDGTTQGGVLVSAGGSSTSLDALTDTNLVGVSNSDVLSFNASSNKWESTAVPGVGTISLNNLTDVYIQEAPSNMEALVFDGANWTGRPISDFFTEQQNYKINIVGDDSTIMVDTDTGNLTGNLTGNVIGNVTGNLTGNVTGEQNINAVGAHTGTLDGDVTGSVFSDDSSILVDGISSQIVGGINSPYVITPEITVNSEAGESSVNVIGVANGSIGPRLVVNSSRGTIEVPTVVIGGSDGDGLMDLHGTGWDGNSYAVAGIVRVGVDLDATVADGVVPGRINFITANSSGSLVNLLTFNSAGNLGIGLPRPLQKLHVNGNAQVDGFVQFGSLTTTERNALTAANGMVIYNSTDNKFQGRENGSWVNLV